MQVQSTDKNKANKFYDTAFYEYQMGDSYRSAKIYADWLGKIYKPVSVADFGCGRGTWLKAFKEEIGSIRLVGFDGPWNSQTDMLDPAIELVSLDLNHAVLNGLSSERFDLAMTLEVAEHLMPERSPAVVKSLCALADVVMFGAAFSFQPGQDHINTRPNSFWAKLFRHEGYLVFDYFRPTMWGRTDVPYWYQQNTFLYVRDSSPFASTLKDAGFAPLPRLELMDFVHPALLDWHANVSIPGRIRRDVSTFLKNALPQTIVTFIRNSKRRH